MAEDPFTRLITKNTDTYNDNGIVLQDGSGVLFSTSDPLDPADIADAEDPQQRDVYLNKDGAITFLTPGLATSVALTLVGATDDGSTFYVETTGQLDPVADTDGSGTDIYAITNGVAKLVSTSLNDPQTLTSFVNFEGVTPDGSVVYFSSDQQFALTDQDGGGEDIYAYRPNDPTPDATQVSTSADDPQLNTDAEFCGASDSGSVTAFAISSAMVVSDTDGTGYDVYRRQSGVTTQASTSQDEASPQILGITDCRGVSHDGTAVAFETTIQLTPIDDTNKRDVFTFDGISPRWVSTSPLDPASNSHSTFGDMSPDGDTVYFNSGSPLLAADGDDADVNDNDGYSVGPPGAGNVLTLLTGGTAAAGDTEDGGATIELVSKDGSAVIFSSGDSYVPSDNDADSSDIYARFNGGPVKLISTGPTDANSSVNMNLQFDDNPPINRRWGASADGSIIAYNTNALLTSDDVDSEYDVYAHIIPKPVIPASPLPFPADTSAPSITSAKLSNKSFAIDKKVKALTVAKSKPRKGTKISFALNEAGSVTLEFQSRTPGRTSGSRCVKATSKNKTAKKCTIVKTVKTAKTSGALGTTSLSFGGRIGGTTLKPGDYQVLLTATDAVGNSGIGSATRTLKFTVVKP
ncbi:MAG: hypothetical protein JHD02_06435 [Thermoleophilaceae bacterium]|nr:hypothetical protein [Thermoleophilaceae bacterium]